MKERPILFSTDMVQAILEGRKTQTRRVIKFPKWMQVDTAIEDIGHIWVKDQLDFKLCPYGLVGDRLWVRETFVLESDLEYVGDTKLPTDRPINTIPDDGEWGKYHLIPHYRATEPEPNIVSEDQEDFDDRTRWTPSIFMPRWASRITLEITDIRVGKLQDITEEDAINEGVLSEKGIKDWEAYPLSFATKTSPKDEYQRLWNSINGKKYPWDSNPWIWVITFKKV